jgi:lipid A 4'-phosphatase
MVLMRARRLTLYCLLATAVLAFVLFWDGRLDLWAANLFYHPDVDAKNPWFEQQKFLWTFFYHGAPWMTGVLLIGSLVLFALKKWRLYSVFIFLVITLGPGLFINSFFKPYWGRPRPREVVELGGKYPYRPFYLADFGGPGKAFPCGHCSVGFAYGAFYLIHRRSRPWLARGFLAGSLLVGVLMGIGRMAAGGHFLSDVVWAGLITWSVTYWLYYKALKIPEREAGTFAGQQKFTFLEKKPVAYLVYSTLGVLTATGLMLASPFYKEIDLPFDPVAVENLNIDIEQGNVEVLLNIQLERAFEISGYVKGFGFPSNKVTSVCQREAGTVSCRISRRGFFSDYEGVMKVLINPIHVKNLRLQLKEGDIDLSRAGRLPENYQIVGP